MGIGFGFVFFKEVQILTKCTLKVNDLVYSLISLNEELDKKEGLSSFYFASKGDGNLFLIKYFFLCKAFIYEKNILLFVFLL